MKRFLATLLLLLPVLIFSIVIIVCAIDEKNSDKNNINDNDNNQTPLAQICTHEYEDDYTCHDRKCVNCDYVLVAITGHEYEDDYTCHDRKCVNCGYVLVAITGHEYEDDYTCHDRKCVNCDYISVATSSHDFVNGKCKCGKQTESEVYQGLVLTLINNCTEYEIIDYVGSAKEVVVPTLYLDKPITSIGYRAFYGCGSLESISIPNSITSIGAGAFTSCTSLTSITIGNNVKNIGSYAFYDCDSLTIYCEAISEPSGWSSSWNYSNCPLVYDYINNETANDGYIYTVIEGIRYSLKDGEATVVRQPRNITTANILSSVTYKGETYSVTSIIDTAFAYCHSLTSIEIGSGVTSMGASAFFSCDALTSIEIGSGVTSIGNYAFSSCDALTIYCEAISEPSSWSSSWNYSNCMVVWDYKNNEVANDGYIYSVIDGIRYGIKDGVATVVRQPENITTANIPSSITYKGQSYSVTSIGYRAFHNCGNLESVLIDNGIISIGKEAFYNCISLNSVVIGSGVSTIGNYAFKYCSRLTSVTFEENSQLTSIGDYAFLYCSSLKSIVIPSSVTSIGYVVFRECSSLESIKVEKDNAYYKDIDGNLYSKDGTILIQYAIGKTATTFTIPNGVTNINEGAFGYCKTLKSVEIPNSLKEIGDYAFYECEALTGIEIPSSVTRIGSSVFYECTALTGVVLGNGVTSIGSYVFYGCSSLKSVIIGKSLTSIGEYSFYECPILSNILVAEDNLEFKDINGNLYSKDGTILIQYAIGKTATSFTIPNSVTSIGDYAFSNCTRLTSLVIPTSVTSIGSYVFSGCDSLTIYCEAQSKPSSWDSSWNCDCTVEWGYKNN